MKYNKLIWIIGIIALILLFSGGEKAGKKTAGESVTRSVPSPVSVNEEVTITLTGNNLPSGYGAIIYEDIPDGWTYVSGGALEGTKVKGLLLSLSGPSFSYKLKAPSVASASFFTGTYQFSTDPGPIATTSSQVVTQAQSQCSGVCKPNACSSYGSCSAISGACSSGNCCSGTCTSCTSHYSFDCNLGDVYWKNSCGALEELKQDCGTGTCALGVCSGGCTPAQTCTTKGYTCGTFTNDCGTSVSCGNCGNGYTCTSNVCTLSSCTPTDSCSSKGYTCGSFANSCGSTISCGSCGTGQTCTSHACVDTPTESKCDFPETENDSGVCEVASWVYWVGGFIGIMFLMRMMTG